MKTIRLGQSGMQVSRIAQGCMTLSEDRGQAMATIRAALDNGITFFDHADVYGRGRREETFSAIWEEAPGLRERVWIQSKCGIRPGGDPDARAGLRYDFSYAHIIEAVNGSLRRLKTDHLDSLLLHRPDVLVEPEEVAKAFDRLAEQGKVRCFGVSNHTAAQIQFLQRWVDRPLVANQLQVSLLHTQLFDEGVVMNRDDAPTPTRNEGTLEFCRLHDMTIQAWSPLARGLASGRTASEPRPQAEGAAALVAQLAAEKGVAPDAVVIAWLLRHPAQIQPVIGTTNPARIAAACQADAVELTREEWYALYTAGRGRSLP
jgi:predicted oxidoreductase